jgi:Tfp pilus assembly protein PilF
LCAGFAAAAGAKPEPQKLELRGRITGFGRMRMARVTLFGVDSPFAESTVTDLGGEFRFHSLQPGTYSLAVSRRSLGEVRRTVVVSAGLADRKGSVHVTIRYSSTEAMADKSAGTISRQQLAVPKRAWNEFLSAQKRLAKRDADGAKQHLEKAVAIAPQFSAAWNSLGVMAYQKSDLTEAEADFRKALAIEPNAFEPAVNLGGVLLGRGRLEEALQYNRQAVAARPRDALANAQAGMTYFQMGDIDRAEPLLIAAQRADPSHFSRPQLFLAMIYMERGDVDAARRELADCIARHPDDPDTPRIRGQLRDLAARETTTAP